MSYVTRGHVRPLQGRFPRGTLEVLGCLGGRLVSPTRVEKRRSEAVYALLVIAIKWETRLRFVWLSLATSPSRPLVFLHLIDNFVTQLRCYIG